ncbi:MAG: GNAT family N-acetyltransferase [Clostridia bacterium]|nr:GNAT family N-acetyltransferase [Clostridia bacterium]
MISYKKGSYDLIDEVKPLWEKLNSHHRANSKYFKTQFEKSSYEKRKKHFNDARHLYIQMAYDEDKRIGYVVASVNEMKVGEIESIFLDENYRGQKIGEVLMENALNWIENQSADRIILGVSVGNEQAFSFYEKFGFYPRTTILQRK